MTHDQFEALVTRLEASARKNPSIYRLRVYALALAGYGYLGLAIALLLGLMILALLSMAYLKVLGLKIALAIGVFLWVVLRALWVKFTEPEGVNVTREYAPELFALIDRLRSRLGSARFHHVLITNEYNASVVQVPRLGIFGWHRNYLMIGLPLMKALTTPQLEAVLAHEFGHLAGGHGRLSNWIYRLRLSWYQLLAVLDHKQSRGSFLFHPFFKWYAPYFNAYSFPLARANEYEADAASARLTSPRAAAEALTNVEVTGDFLQESYWPGLHRKADEFPAPSFAPFATMGESVASGIDPAAAQRWLERALSRKTTVDNTHPSLSDRLQAIGEEAHLAAPPPGQSSDVLLGASLLRVTELFDQRWKDGIASAWDRRHRFVQDGRVRLAALDERARSEVLPLDEAIERARLTDDLGAGVAAAIEQLRALHEREPANAVVAFDLGRRLLESDDDGGLPLIESAILAQRSIAVVGYGLLRDYCWRKGRQDEAKAWQEKYLDAAQEQSEAAREREILTTKDAYMPHGLAPDELAALQEKLRAIPRVRKAYLVRKHLQRFPERPLLALGFTVTPWWRYYDKRAADNARTLIASDVAFPFGALIICVEGENSSFKGKFSRVSGSRII